jgi:broad specificity phosphatase PhoE
MRKLIVLGLLILAVVACQPKQQAKTIYLVRHAEKQLVGDDPELSVAGTVRAKKLAQILDARDIRHILSTNTIRTKATAQPLATANGLEIEIYDAKEHDALVKELRSREGNILVVGHSNTIHHVANYFFGEGEKYPELTDIEYDFIFEVKLDDEGGSSVVRKIFKEY